MFEQRTSSSQRDISDSQFAKIQQNILSNDSYTFKKKGNEEQFKAKVQVIDKLREANSHLTDSLSQSNSESTASAKVRASEGLDSLNHRQKLIKLADSSELGWKVVQEYESHPLADNSDDAKRMYRATARATRKMKQDRVRFQRGPRLYSNQLSIVNSTPANQSFTYQPMRKPGLCFSCGRSCHCPKQMVESADRNKNTQMSIYSYFSKADKCGLDKTCTFSGSLAKEVHEVSILVPSKKCKSVLSNVRDVQTEMSTESILSKVLSPVGKLRSAERHWEDSGVCNQVLEIIRDSYKLYWRTLETHHMLKW